jgi:uncharacterized protein YbbK (DUF523 family)/uncharacterized protein YbgA (DUF1722 family)
VPGEPPVRLGVSACLLGERVRWDGGHKRDRFVADRLARHVVWVPVCPEVAIGLGVPRETVRLERRGGGVRMVAPASGEDHTVAMRRWARGHLDELARARLHGFVLKEGSPSCGLFGVKLRRAGGRTRRDGRGLFASELVARFAVLPVEEEGRLADAGVRESFVERVFAYARWTRLLDGGAGAAEIAAFHAAHETTLRAHGPAACARLARLAARAPSAGVAERYGALFLATLAAPVPRARHVAAMRRLAATVSARTSPAERARLDAALRAYRGRRAPRVVPLKLLRALLRRHRAPAWASSQTYLAPYPDELMPR